MCCDDEYFGRARVMLADIYPFTEDVRLLEILIFCFKRFCAGCDEPEESKCVTFIVLCRTDGIHDVESFNRRGMV